MMEQPTEHTRSELYRLLVQAEALSQRLPRDATLGILLRRALIRVTLYGPHERRH